MIISLVNQSKSTLQLEWNQEIFYQTFHVGINKENFYNENFIFNVYLLIIKKLNPFSLDRKLNDQNKHQMIYDVMERMYDDVMKRMYAEALLKASTFARMKTFFILMGKMLFNQIYQKL